MSYIKHSMVKFLDILPPGSCFKTERFSASTHTGHQQNGPTVVLHTELNHSAAAH